MFTLTLKGQISKDEEGHLGGTGQQATLPLAERPGWGLQLLPSIFHSPTFEKQLLCTFYFKLVWDGFSIEMTQDPLYLF